MLSDTVPAADTSLVFEGWVVPAATLLIAQFVLAAVLNLFVGRAINPPIFSYCEIALAVSAVLGGVVLFLRRGGRGDNITGIANAALGLQFVALELGVLMWAKVLLPMVIPFWADPYLAAADRLFLGRDAWTYFPIGPGWFNTVMGVSYSALMPAHLAVVLAILYAPQSLAKSRHILAFMTIWAVGFLTQYILSSAGPLYYERLGFGDRFAGMWISGMTRAPAEYLWRTYDVGEAGVGTGISSMPSMHVALALWMALALSRTKACLPAWVYFVLINVGSVYLGWHYAVDAIGGAAVAIAGWLIARKVARA